MRNKIYQFSSVRDSSLLYKKKVPMFGYILIILTLILMCVFFVWSFVSIKSSVLHVTGVVTEINKTNVMNSVSGTITTINVEDGAYVNEGDNLIKLSTSQVEAQISQVTAMKELYERKINNYKRLLNFIDDYFFYTAENPFDKNNVEELNFYSEVEYFRYLAIENNYDYEGLIKYKESFISQRNYYSSIDECYSQVIYYDSQREMYENSIDQYSILAPISGYIHLTNGITIGTSLSSTTLLGTITSGNKEDIILQASVSATERSKLKNDMNVDIAISGVSQYDYGTIKGKVNYISSDSTTTQDGNIYYVVNIKPEVLYIKDNKDNQIDLSLGMIGDCRIIYSETTYLNWAISQIIDFIK